MKMSVVLLIVFSVSIESFAELGSVYIDHGSSFTIDNNTYLDDHVYLDKNTANHPGTHVDMVDGGLVGGNLIAYNNATINMVGGTVGYRIYGFDDSIIHMSGGSITGELVAKGSSPTIYLSGGSVWGLVAMWDGIIYLDGTDFAVNGTPLKYGDRLSNFVTLTESRPNGAVHDHYTGTVTGTLADGTDLNGPFYIFQEGHFAGTGDIIIIPEPATLCLLAIGGFVLRRKRNA